jgi:hypothetical protein
VRSSVERAKRHREHVPAAVGQWVPD